MYFYSNGFFLPKGQVYEGEKRDKQIGDREATQTEIDAYLAKQTIQQQIAEANAYLRDTDWVETYKLRHDLGLEIIPETSSKWEVLAKRGECKTFLRDNS